MSMFLKWSYKTGVTDFADFASQLFQNQQKTTDFYYRCVMNMRFRVTTVI